VVTDGLGLDEVVAQVRALVEEDAHA
jgi:hypothetical protein